MNTADTGGGSGGGIFDLSGGTPVSLNQCTISRNTSSNGGGFASISLANNVITFFDCIIAGNINGTGPDIYGTTPVLMGNNLTNGNPLLGLLDDYGGPTLTMAPVPGSPAIDGGDNSATNLFATDQRGLPRLSGSRVDIGSVEVQAARQPLMITGQPGTGTGEVQVVFSNVSGGNFTVFASSNLALPFAGWENLGGAVETPAGSGQYLYWDYQATNGQRFYRVVSP